MKRAFAIAGLALLLAGCAGTPFKWDNARQMKEGMTQQEVIALMGSPYSVKVAGKETLWTWSYANGMTGRTRAVSVVFVDGRLLQPPEFPFQD